MSARASFDVVVVGGGPAGGVAREDAATLDIPQDRVLVYSGDRLDWA
mgnify:CR=1 FL=1